MLFFRPDIRFDEHAIVYSTRHRSGFSGTTEYCKLLSMAACTSDISTDAEQTMDNTLANNSVWNSQLDFTTGPAQPFASYQPLNSNMKRPLQVDTQEFPQSKRHESAGYASNFTSPFLPSASLTTSSWNMDTQQTTPCSTSVDVGLSDEAADVCAMWFSKYAVLPK